MGGWVGRQAGRQVAGRQAGGCTCAHLSGAAVVRPLLHIAKCAACQESPGLPGSFLPLISCSPTPLTPPLPCPPALPCPALLQLETGFEDAETHAKQDVGSMVFNTFIWCQVSASSACWHSSRQQQPPGPAQQQHQHPAPGTHPRLSPKPAYRHAYCPHPHTLAPPPSLMPRCSTAPPPLALPGCRCST